jgi:hypothetical protein
MKNTEQLNLEFKKASKAEKRVMIAGDVIKQVKARKYEATCGLYVDFNFGGSNPKGVVVGGSVQETLLTKNPKCKVCGIGSLMLSAIRYNNNVKWKESDWRDSSILDEMDYYDNGDLIYSKNDENAYLDASKNLNKFFSERQLRLIESAFEVRAFHSDNQQYVEAEEFGQKFIDDKKRLLAIMNNIVENKGTFKP